MRSARYNDFCVRLSAIFLLSCATAGTPAPAAIAIVGSGASAPVVEKAPTIERGSITSGGHERTFLYMTHASPNGLLPLVIALHGRLGDGAGQDKLSHFSTIAAREKFLLALPDGYSRSWADARGVTPAAQAGYDDVGFMADLIQWFVTNHHADPARIYMTGMSNGGFMTVTAACKLSDEIAAFAIVGAEVSAGIDCKPSSPVSGMIIMGDEDPLVPYHGGKMEGRGMALSAIQSINLWGKLDGCITFNTTPLPDTDPKDGTYSTVGKWTGCTNGVELELVSVIGGGHTWPNGWQYLGAWIVGKTAKDFDASERIWSFFATKKK